MSSVTIGMTTKGINSTSRVMSGGVSLDCRLKEPCGLHDPVFIVKGLSKSYNNYNFCTWRGRYYWVNEIVFLTNDIQEVHCSLDPLATFKGAIDDTYAYVQYGDAGNWNHYIDDVRLSPELEAPEWSGNEMFDLTTYFNETGVVVMRFMDCGNGGGVKTVSMSPSNFLSMLEDLYSLFNGKAIDELGAYLGGLGSWRDNIFSCRWLPLNIATSGSSQLRLGGIDCNVPCYYYQNVIPIYTYDGTIDLSVYWANFADYPFAKTSRWTSIQVTTPFGYADIPIDYLRNQTTLYYRTAINAATGEISIKFSERTTGDGYCYATFAGDLGVDLMGILGTGVGFRQGVANAMRFGGQLGIAAASAGISAGGAFLGGAQSMNKVEGSTAADAKAMGTKMQNKSLLSSGINGIASCVPTGVGHTGGSGSIGGGAERLWLTSPIGMGVFTIKAFRPLLQMGYDDYCDMYGYPVNYYLQLSSVTGFCKCSGAFVRDIPGATPADISSINSFLNNGIVLEA